MQKFGMIAAAFLALGSAAQAQVTVVSAASFDADGVLAPGSIASAFGTNLAPAIEAATTTPLPTTLHGVRVTVTDLALQTVDCPLFFVSPGQINFLIPEGLAVGTATVRVRPAAALSEEGPGQNVQQGTITLAKVAQGIFTQTDLNWAAAFLLRVAADGTQTRESIYYANELGQIVPRLLELSRGGDESDVFYLELYGTGFKNVGGPDKVLMLIGNSVNTGSFTDVDIVPTLYAGPQGSPGLDQVTVGPLSRRIEHFGGGDVPMLLLTQGRDSNEVWMQVAPNPNAPAISNADFSFLAGPPAKVRYGFDFTDGDGDLGPFRIVVSWEDATQICTTRHDLPAGSTTGQTSRRVQFELDKPSGTQLGPIEKAVVTVSDPMGHISNLVTWFPEPPGSMPGFMEQCLSLIQK